MALPVHPGSIAELLEPAIEGPPSPESIRAFSNQMRQASNMEKHQSRQSRQSHHTSSSGSSSLRSMTFTDRPSWDQNPESAATSLSRKSSGRSTSSSMPSRDRHESIQIFGKTLFGKRGRLHRESSAPSSNSSLYSSDIPLEKSDIMSPPLPTPTSSIISPVSASSFSSASSTASASVWPPLAGNRDTFMPSFFSRRRSTKSGSIAEENEGHRKLQISEPYNFQHLTHSERDHLTSLQRTSRVLPASADVNGRPPLRRRSPSDGSSRGVSVDNLLFADFSSEALPISDDSLMSPPANSRKFPLRKHASSVSSAYPPPRSLLHTRSQDQLRSPPPRPPRSPIEASAFSPPVPPPRISSRVSIRYGDFDPLASTTLERPKTSGGFRQPTPFTLPSGEPVPPIYHAHAHSYSADLDLLPLEQRRYSQMLAGPISPPMPACDDTNWPLPSNLAATSAATTFSTLPGVPEEEEQQLQGSNRNSVRKCRMSVASNSSSLRGSQSLPLLRQFIQSQSTDSQRPPSGASDTLGHFDIFTAQCALRESMTSDENAKQLSKESWEDAIDYCYEHAVEADCDYAWDRSSLDLSRESILADLDESSSYSFDRRTYRAGSNTSSGTERERDQPDVIVSMDDIPSVLDIPALSPASEASSASISEVVTPMGLAARRPNLSIKTELLDSRLSSHRFLHVRSASQASSFKESHGFNLSPSFFIPGADNFKDHNALARGSRIGFAIGADDDEDDLHHALSQYDGTLSLHASSLLLPARASGSTTASHESRDSVASSFSEHPISATSTSTDLTSMTSSTASIIEDLIPKVEHEHYAIAI